MDIGLVGVGSAYEVEMVNKLLSKRKTAQQNIAGLLDQ